MLTKTDLRLNKKVLANLLENTSFSLGHGYMGVCLRNGNEIEQGMSIEDKIKLEKKYHNSLGFSDTLNMRLGVPNLRIKLSEILLQRTSSQLPKIIQILDDLIEETKESESFLDTLVLDMSWLIILCFFK